jgi:hypothetical protein
MVKKDQVSYVDTEERSPVRNFEMTCYYVAPFARNNQCGTGGQGG